MAMSLGVFRNQDCSHQFEWRLWRGIALHFFWARQPGLGFFAGGHQALHSQTWIEQVIPLVRPRLDWEETVHG
jgi:hypothetical protein